MQNEYCAEMNAAESGGAAGSRGGTTLMEKNLCYQVPLNDEDLETNLFIPLLEMITKGKFLTFPFP